MLPVQCFSGFRAPHQVGFFCAWTPLGHNEWIWQGCAFSNYFAVFRVFSELPGILKKAPCACIFAYLCDYVLGKIYRNCSAKPYILNLGKTLSDCWSGRSIVWENTCFPKCHYLLTAFHRSLFNKIILISNNIYSLLICEKSYCVFFVIFMSEFQQPCISFFLKLCKCLLPFSRLSFYFVHGFLHCEEVFLFDVDSLVNFCFSCHCFWG